MTTLNADQVYSPYVSAVDSISRQLMTLDNTIREQVGLNPEHIAAFTKALEGLSKVHEVIHGRWAEALDAEVRAVVAEAAEDARASREALLDGSEQRLLAMVPALSDGPEVFLSLRDEPKNVIARLRELGFIFDTHTGKGYRRTKAGSAWLAAHMAPPSGDLVVAAALDKVKQALPPTVEDSDD